jgi:Uma2 family endonuclease
MPVARVVLPEEVIVSVQNPVHLSDYSEPQPDIAILRPKENFYEDAHPTATDIFWLIEVADTSLDYDKKVKLPLYARAGVPEVWLVNLPKSRLEVYYHPFNDTYQEIRLLHKEQTLVLNSFPDINLSISDLLG